jgi:hypothetical protein
MTTTTTTLTDSQSRGLGALAARTQLRQIESGRRRELNRPDAWCCDRERHAGLRTSEGFDAWHDGWASEMVEVRS